MAQFYASIKGSRGEATRMGSKASGITAHVRGWDVGVKVRVFVDERTGLDCVLVTRTSGSNGSDREVIAEFYADDPPLISQSRPRTQPRERKAS